MNILRLCSQFIFDQYGNVIGRLENAIPVIGTVTVDVESGVEVDDQSSSGPPSPVLTSSSPSSPVPVPVPAPVGLTQNVPLATPAPSSALRLRLAVARRTRNQAAADMRAKEKRRRPANIAAVELENKKRKSMTISSPPTVAWESKKEFHAKLQLKYAIVKFGKYRGLIAPLVHQFLTQAELEIKTALGETEYVRVERQCFELYDTFESLMNHLNYVLKIDGCDEDEAALNIRQSGNSDVRPRPTNRKLWPNFPFPPLPSQPASDYIPFDWEVTFSSSDGRIEEFIIYDNRHVYKSDFIILFPKPAT